MSCAISHSWFFSPLDFIHTRYLTVIVNGIEVVVLPDVELTVTLTVCGGGAVDPPRLARSGLRRNGAGMVCECLFLIVQAYELRGVVGDTD
jgi:hypothetical protein